MEKPRTTKTSTWVKYINSNKGIIKWWIWINNRHPSCKASPTSSNPCFPRYPGAPEGPRSEPHRHSSNRWIRANRISIPPLKRYLLCGTIKRPIKHLRFCIQICTIRRSCPPRIKCRAQAIWINLSRTSSSTSLVSIIQKTTRSSWMTPRTTFWFKALAPSAFSMQIIHWIRLSRRLVNKVVPLASVNSLSLNLVPASSFPAPRSRQTCNRPKYEATQTQKGLSSKEPPSSQRRRWSGIQKGAWLIQRIIACLDLRALRET